MDDRARNMMLLLRVRPGLFEPNDQAEWESINYEIKKTVVLAFAGFAGTSGFRFWQIKNNNNSVLLGVSVILISYAPSMAYY